jgi:hypothetical protein
MPCRRTLLSDSDSGCRPTSSIARSRPAIPPYPTNNAPPAPPAPPAPLAPSSSIARSRPAIPLYLTDNAPPAPHTPPTSPPCTRPCASRTVISPAHRCARTSAHVRAPAGNSTMTVRAPAGRPQLPQHPIWSAPADTLQQELQQRQLPPPPPPSTDAHERRLHTFASGGCSNASPRPCTPAAFASVARPQAQRSPTTTLLPPPSARLARRRSRAAAATPLALRPDCCSAGGAAPLLQPRTPSSSPRPPRAAQPHPRPAHAQPDRGVEVSRRWCGCERSCGCSGRSIPKVGCEWKGKTYSGSG